jgi:regulator of replication initiation timing
MKNRMASLEETVNQLAREIKDLAAVNSLLKEENKALLEENQLLKRHLSSPSSTVSTNTKAMSYADITTKCAPLKFYTKAGSQLPREIIEPAPTQSNNNIAKISSTDIYSPLKFVYFEGCHRKTAST